MEEKDRTCASMKVFIPFDLLCGDTEAAHVFFDKCFSSACLAAAHMAQRGLRTPWALEIVHLRRACGPPGNHFSARRRMVWRVIVQ